MAAPPVCVECGGRLVGGDPCPCGYRLPDEIVDVEDLRLPDPSAKDKALAAARAAGERARKRGRLTRDRPEPGSILRGQR